MPTSVPTGRKLLDAEAILGEARLSAGMKYADFGAGALGHFIFPAARMVGPGTPVYAVDILKSVLQAIESRARLEQVSNITTVWGNIEVSGGVRIPPGSLDLITMVNIPRLIVDHPAVLQEARRLLKEDGKILIVGWQKDSALPIAPPKEKRVSVDEIKQCAEAAGMVPMKEFDAGKEHWGLLVRLHPFKDYPVKIIG